MVVAGVSTIAGVISVHQINCVFLHSLTQSKPTTFPSEAFGTPDKTESVIQYFSQFKQLSD